MGFVSTRFLLDITSGVESMNHCEGFLGEIMNKI